MKKIISFSLIGAVLVLSGCASQDATADYNYENQAPYASERTVGGETVQSAEPVFSKRQHK